MSEKTATQFITGIDGNKVEVTDLDAAITQATNYVQMHEKARIAKKENPEKIVYFKVAHAEWAHTLAELLKLQQTA